MTEHIRSSNMTAPGMRMQFKSALGKHLNPDYTVDKNVSYLELHNGKKNYKVRVAHPFRNMLVACRNCFFFFL